jgi:hypothetical protein
MAKETQPDNQPRCIKCGNLSFLPPYLSPIAGPSYPPSDARAFAER